MAAYCFSCELGLRANSPGRSGGGGGKRKESTSLQLFLWNSNICIEKVDAKCWLAEMTQAMTSFPLARVFQWLFTFLLVSASRWLTEIWQLSQRGATGELEVEFQFQNSSCKLSFLFLSLPLERAGELARRLERTGENGGFLIRWCHTSYSACPVRHVIVLLSF